MTNYRIQASGQTDKDLSKVKARLESFLRNLGELEYITVNEDFDPDKHCYISRVAAWGFIQNYLSDGAVTNKNQVAEAIGASPSTTQRCLNELMNLGVVKGGPREYIKQPQPKRGLEKYLNTHAIVESKWQPKHITFSWGRYKQEEFDVPPYVPLTTPREKRTRVKVETTNHDLLNLLDKTGEAMSTKLLADLSKLNRSTVHRLMVRFLEAGLVDLDQTGHVNAWSLSDKYETLRSKR